MSAPVASTAAAQGGDSGSAPSLVDKVIAHILERGSSTKLVPVINVALVLLLFTLLATALVGGANIHVLVMAVLAICLFASVNWFVYELGVARAAEGAAEQPKTREVGAGGSEAVSADKLQKPKAE